MYKNVMLVLILLLLSACGLFGSYYEPEPVGIGRASDELLYYPSAPNFIASNIVSLLFWNKAL